MRELKKISRVTSTKNTLPDGFAQFSFAGIIERFIEQIPFVDATLKMSQHGLNVIVHNFARFFVGEFSVA